MRSWTREGAVEGPRQGAWPAAPVSGASGRVCTSAYPHPGHCGKARSQGRGDEGKGEVTRDGPAPEAALRPAAPSPQDGLSPVPGVGRTPSPLKKRKKKISSAVGTQIWAAPCSSGDDYISWIGGGEQMAYVYP